MSVTCCLCSEIAKTQKNPYQFQPHYDQRNRKPNEKQNLHFQLHVILIFALSQSQTETVTHVSQVPIVPPQKKNTHKKFNRLPQKIDVKTNNNVKTKNVKFAGLGRRPGRVEEAEERVEELDDGGGQARTRTRFRRRRAYGKRHWNSRRERHGKNFC